jgi:hypothetical protein
MNKWKDKWKNISLNQNNIDEYMTDLVSNTKGQYITQGVTFNKDDPYQLALLKAALLDHTAFSSLVRHLLNMYFTSGTVESTFAAQVNNIKPLAPVHIEPVIAPKADTTN